MGAQLLPPINPEQDYLAAVVGRLDAQNELLAQIRDRLPAPVEIVLDGKPGPINIREPFTAPAVEPGDTPPSGPAGDTPATTAIPARRTPAKKAASTAKKGTK